MLYYLISHYIDTSWNCFVHAKGSNLLNFPTFTIQIKIEPLYPHLPSIVQNTQIVGLALSIQIRKYFGISISCCLSRRCILPGGKSEFLHSNKAHLTSGASNSKQSLEYWSLWILKKSFKISNWQPI